MLPRDILQQVRRIHIRTSRLVDDVLAGAYHSTFKGRGMEFDEVREYMPGDEVRTIDWNVTARLGRPFVRRYVEERALCLWLTGEAFCSLTMSHCSIFDSPILFIFPAFPRRST